ncbi:MAG: alginate O-acetyltransferase [Candidatus Xenobia bacterium]
MSSLSLPYILMFLPLSIAILARWRRPWALACLSALFYLLVDWRAFPSFLLSLGLNYSLAGSISRETSPPIRLRKLWLGLFANVLWLFSYKLVASGWDLVAEAPGESPLAPIGLSFYTIQQIMVLVDSYQGVWVQPARLDYWNFVAFFPQVVAGPIPRPSDTLEQHLGFSSNLPRWDDCAAGLFVFSFGLFKKVVLADSLAMLVDPGYAQVEGLRVLDAWVVAVGYYLQIFLDFSGYSDMALGAGLMLGIRLPINFERPYRCSSLVRFWSEWHMSLTAFITNYVYFSLARLKGRRVSFSWAMTATWLSMVICGLWHGLTVMFLLWGAMHGFGLVAHHLWHRRRGGLPRLAALALTQVFVILSFVLFRSPDLTTCSRMLGNLAGWAGTKTILWGDRFDTFDSAIISSSFVLGAAVAFLAPSTRQLLEDFKPGRSQLLVTTVAFLLGCLFLCSSRGVSFIYAHF